MPDVVTGGALVGTTDKSADGSVEAPVGADEVAVLFEEPVGTRSCAFVVHRSPANKQRAAATIIMRRVDCVIRLLPAPGIKQIPNQIRGNFYSVQHRTTNRQWPCQNMILTASGLFAPGNPKLLPLPKVSLITLPGWGVFWVQTNRFIIHPFGFGEATQRVIKRP